uniref:Uncharacterized protein n=1 Tax=Trimeris anceps TaxID=368681 RepID=A0A1L6BSJ5_9ASTR|nr:hypothetical protein Lo_anc1Pt0117 [Lobelia anceps]APQ38989.1 hypothetical protein Lo_anc1Pt0117 [Lobelia anceps]
MTVLRPVRSFFFKLMKLMPVGVPKVLVPIPEKEDGEVRRPESYEHAEGPMNFNHCAYNCPKHFPAKDSCKYKTDSPANPVQKRASINGPVLGSVEQKNPYCNNNNCEANCLPKGARINGKRLPEVEQENLFRKLDKVLKKFLSTRKNRNLCPFSERFSERKKEILKYPHHEEGHLLKHYCHKYEGHTYGSAYGYKGGHSKIFSEIFRTAKVEGAHWMDQTIDRLPKTRRAWKLVHDEVQSLLIKEATKNPQKEEHIHARELGFFHGALALLKDRKREFSG